MPAPREQALTASGSNKKIYEDKAIEQLQALTNWLREKMTTAIEVTYQGRSRSLAEVIQGKIPPGPKPSIRDVVNTAASVCLAPHFENHAPDYPIFSILVTRENRAQAAQEALRYIAGSVKSKQGAAILDALGLLDGDVLKPLNSRYAKQILDQLAQKSKGQVLNRSEIVKEEGGHRLLGAVPDGTGTAGRRPRLAGLHRQPRAQRHRPEIRRRRARPAGQGRHGDPLRFQARGASQGPAARRAAGTVRPALRAQGPDRQPRHAR